MFNRLKLFVNSKFFIEFLFTAFLIFFPFGASLIKLSIGFMTIYPSLIILFLLFFFGLFHLNKIKFKIEKYALSLLIVWIIYAFVQYLYLIDKAYALMDIRSLLVFLLYLYVFIWTRTYLGLSRLFEIINFLFKIIYALIFLFAVFEVFTGIHFIGHFTDKVGHGPITLALYSPVFLWDNPNNLVVFFLLASSIILLTEKKTKNIFSLILIILSTNLFIAYTAQARIGEFAIFVFAFSLFPYIFFMLKRNKILKKKLAIITMVILLFAVHFIALPKYYGPIWSKQKDNLGTLKTTNEHSGIYELDAGTPNDSIIKKYDSKKIRISLILNGLELFRTSNYLGVGPGQFKLFHKDRQVQYYTKTNIGPHNWTIEIISQYGVFIFIAYLILFGWIILIVIKNFRQNIYKSTLILFSIILFFLLSNLPSSFINHPINWLFTSILILVTTSLQQVNTESIDE